MKVLVLGGAGMAGHVITAYMKKSTNDLVCYTTRDAGDPEGIYLDAYDDCWTKALLHSLKPDVVINCIGLLNENAEHHHIDAIRINSLLPHHLAKWIQPFGAKLIHISTDCVFSGKKGYYKEQEVPDGTSTYARTKVLGEVTCEPHLTIRTSIIGPELKNGIGLFQWFMKQTGDIKGFQQVKWNGITTLELAKAIQAMIAQSVSGLYHLTAPKNISKYQLLKMIQKVFEKKDISIHPDSNKVLDRTLVNTRKDFQYKVSSYQQMLAELRDWLDRR